MVPSEGLVKNLQNHGTEDPAVSALAGGTAIIYKAFAYVLRSYLSYVGT